MGIWKRGFWLEIPTVPGRPVATSAFAITLLPAKWMIVINAVSACAFLARLTLQPRGQTKSHCACCEYPEENR